MGVHFSTHVSSEATELTKDVSDVQQLLLSLAAPVEFFFDDVLDEWAESHEDECECPMSMKRWAEAN